MTIPPVEGGSPGAYHAVGEDAAGNRQKEYGRAVDGQNGLTRVRAYSEAAIGYLVGDEEEENGAHSVVEKRSHISTLSIQGRPRG